MCIRMYTYFQKLMYLTAFVQVPAIYPVAPKRDLKTTRHASPQPTQIPNSNNNYMIKAFKTGQCLFFLTA